MKNLLFIALLLLSFQPMIAQEETTISETERIVDKYGEKLAQGFTEFMDTATPMAQEGFKVVVTLQYAKGIVYLLPIVCFIIFFIFLNNEYNRIENILNSDNVPHYYNERYGPLSDDNISFKIIILIIFSCILFIMALVFTFDGITHLLAPEWFAIKEIAELF